MLPTLLRIGPLAIHSYGVMMAIAFITALHFIRRDSARLGWNPDVIGDIAFLSLVVGLAGTRILYIIMFHDQFSWSRPLQWFAVWQGGLVFQGAIPCIFVVVYFSLRKHKIPLGPALDMAAPYMALAHGIGRIGCFLNGCCYGKRTNLPWGVPFRRVPYDTSLPATGSPAFLDHCSTDSLLRVNQDHWSYPVHPTQLYSVLGLVTIFLILLYLRNKRPLFPGFVVCSYLVLYGLFRFWIEFLRGDHNPTFFGTISGQQAFALGSVVFVGGLIIVLWRRNRRAKGGKASQPQPGDKT